MTLNKKILILVGFIVIFSFLVACGNEDHEINEVNNSPHVENETNNIDSENDHVSPPSNSENESIPETSLEPFDLSGSPEEPIAIVNGNEISTGEFQEEIEVYEAYFTSEGTEEMTEDELNSMRVQIEQGILDEMIRQLLLLEKVDEYEIEVSIEEIDQYYLDVRNNFDSDDQFEEALVEQGISEESLRIEIEEIISINKLLSAEYIAEEDVHVSEDELQDSYEQQAMFNPEIGEFEDERAQIEESLRAEKFISNLMESAEIEILQ